MEAMEGTAFSFTHIKTPQLIGIVAGCSVFTVTITAVIFLLYKSGTLSRFAEEMMSGAPLSLKINTKENSAPQNSMLPELYEHLLLSASLLPLKPSVPQLCGQNIIISQIDFEVDISNLIKASNGSALYGESAYDPARIWGWMNCAKGCKKAASDSSSSVISWPSESSEGFKESFQETVNSQHLVISDKVTQKQIGMLSLVDNRPQDLCIRIGNASLTRGLFV
jgi:hypothetical protein